MKPWMRIFPKRIRHLIICRWKYGWNTYCVGHGRDLETRYVRDTLYDGWQSIPKRPPPSMRILPKRARHVIICKWRGRYANYCMGHGPQRTKYTSSIRINLGIC